MDNNLEKNITLFSLDTEYYSSGKPKIAKVSSKIITGVGTYYVNNLNKIEESVKEELPTENENINNGILENQSYEEATKEELPQNDFELSLNTPIEEEKPEQEETKVNIPNENYRENAEEIYQKLNDVTPEVVDTKEKDITSTTEANELEIPKENIKNIKSSWNDFRLMYNDKKNDKSDNQDLNFDGVFDSLATDINGVNEYIVNMMNSKNKMDKLNKNLKEQLQELEKKQADFEEYARVERESIEKEKVQANLIIETKKTQLQTEENQFIQQTEATKAELELKEQSLKAEIEQLDKDKKNFTNQKLLDEEAISNENAKINLEKEQMSKEKSLMDEKDKNNRAEIEDMKKQFELEKEIELKKIELERKNLAQSCDRFKELINQFNMGVGQIPAEEE